MMTSPAPVKKPLFILNPSAGVPPVKFIITQELERRRNELLCFKSLSIHDSGTLIKQNFHRHDVFVAAGGDGTVHTVASQLRGTGKILGVLPIGSGNGFAKEMGFRKNVRSLLRDIEKKETIDLDIITINDSMCLNVAGVGLDSFVAHSFDKLRTRGFWSYSWVTITNFIRLRPFRITVRFEGGETLTEDVFDIIIANSRQFGYNAIVAPDADPADGIMDIVILKPFPKYLFPVFVYLLFTGKLNKSKYLKNFTTEGDMTISTSESRFHIDGEPVIINGEITVRLKKNELKILKTKHNRYN